MFFGETGKLVRLIVILIANTKSVVHRSFPPVFPTHPLFGPTTISCLCQVLVKSIFFENAHTK